MKVSDASISRAASDARGPGWCVAGKRNVVDPRRLPLPRTIQTANAITPSRLVPYQWSGQQPVEARGIGPRAAQRLLCRRGGGLIPTRFLFTPGMLNNATTVGYPHSIFELSETARKSSLGRPRARLDSSRDLRDRSIRMRFPNRPDQRRGDRLKPPASTLMVKNER